MARIMDSRKGSRGSAPSLLRRLRQDRSGNTVAIVAASIAPLLAIVGSGIDLGRGYLSETRLQKACDAGVLAARKKLGSAVAATGTPPAGVAATGNQFFNLNFRNGSYGSTNRTFTMTLESDYSISGVATVRVPTTVMGIFGYKRVDISVECSAKLNFTNTDVMMVLDTTGSMNQVNPSDSVSRITALKNVVTSFHAQLEAGKGPGTRIRYGFVPYSTNVNVGHLLADNWVVSNWTYQSIEDAHVTPTNGTNSYNDNYSTPTGSYTPSALQSTYAATYHPAASESASAYYSCDTAAPADTYTDVYAPVGSSVTVPYAGPPAGNQITQRYRRTQNGINYWINQNGTTCEIWRESFSNYVYEYDYVTVPYTYNTQYYRYAPITRSVANWRSETSGCMEERSTYEITDYNNVNFAQALDLDLDKVPTNDAERWRPMYPDIIRARSLDWYGNGSFTTPDVTTTDYWFFRPNNNSSLVACPAQARKLAEMSASDLSSFLATLSPSGFTYHDIGMIWGGRLISKTGLFASENADISGRPTQRHLIFLTDGQTNTYDTAYGSYGLEPLDRRRWTPTSSLSLDQVVEKRFGVACSEVKKKNVVVWVIGFGTNVSQLMKDCAGTGKWFDASDASQLNAAFDKIAGSMGDLRITK